jgi:hypothetical protein
MGTISECETKRIVRLHKNLGSAEEKVAPQETVKVLQEENDG